MVDADPPVPIDDLVARCILALELEGPEAVDGICAAHPDSAAEVRAHLRSLEASGLLQPPKASPGPMEIGPYRLLEPLGHGGMGTVYLAEQREPVRRRVAVKVIRPGMDTQEVLARFALERQALAMMDHPGIIKIFDAGATPQGRPYFAMEFVPGLPLTDYCRTHGLGVEQRLELLISLCDAVQHAHHKGVVHRDLKPSNVLVTEDQNRPEVRIIDFGIAKAIHANLQVPTLYTNLGRMVGTPEYMSPEQARRDVADVDSRTDVYSLGVILFELLTGSLPFPTQRLRASGPDEIQRIISEEMPPTPSSQLATTRADDAAPPSTGIRRRSPVGDLDWITLKALEKDRNRRYATPLELAADLRRYLADEPVLACPPSRGYLLRKFLRRHRLSVTVGVTVFAALAGGLAIAWWQADVARAAEASERTERQRAEAAETQARINAAQAEANLALAASRLEDYQRLKDSTLAAELVKEIHALWPAHPDRVAAMDDWLQIARGLVERGAKHRELLAAIRRRALPLPPETEALIEKVDGLRKRRQANAREREAVAAAGAARAGEAPALSKEAGLIVAELERLEERLETERWRFDDPEDRFLHSMFASIVQRIDHLQTKPGLIALIEARRARAATLHQRSLVAARETWSRVIEAIAASPKYRGMPALVPQLGLVPLGPDHASGLQEFAVLDSGAVPERFADGTLQIGSDTAIVLVLLPPGSFFMGAQATDRNAPNFDPAATPDESPVTEVALDAFFLGKYEVTQHQWLTVGDRNPSQSTRGRPGNGRRITPGNPVENVMWTECEEIARRLGLALPTEAQWEYGARADTSTPWWTGTDPATLQGVANLADRTLGAFAPHWMHDKTLQDGCLVHGPAGIGRPNPFGICNTIGNVREWCRDAWASYKNPPGAGDGARGDLREPYRVIRGGSWFNLPRDARVSLRTHNALGERQSHVGLRLARGIDR